MASVSCVRMTTFVLISELITKAEATNVLSVLSLFSNAWPVGNWVRDILSRGLVNAGLEGLNFMLFSPSENENQISGSDNAVGNSPYSSTWLQLILFATGILWTGAIVWATFKLTRMLSHSVGMHIEMPAINICVNPHISLRNSYNSIRRSLNRIRAGHVSRVVGDIESRGARIPLGSRPLVVPPLRIPRSGPDVYNLAQDDFPDSPRVAPGWTSAHPVPILSQGDRDEFSILEVMESGDLFFHDLPTPPASHIQSPFGHSMSSHISEFHGTQHFGNPSISDVHFAPDIPGDLHINSVCTGTCLPEFSLEPAPSIARDVSRIPTGNYTGVPPPPGLPEPAIVDWTFAPSCVLEPGGAGSASNHRYGKSENNFHVAGLVSQPEPAPTHKQVQKVWSPMNSVLPNNDSRNIEVLSAKFNSLSDERARVHASIQHHRSRSLEPGARVRFEEPRSHSADSRSSMSHKTERILLRPVSIASDQCLFSSPPSSAGTAPSIRNAPMGVRSHDPQPLASSVGSSVDRGRPSAGRVASSSAAASSPVVQAGEPARFGVANGARFPIYEKMEPNIKVEESKSAPEVDVTGGSIPADNYFLKAAFPPAYECSRAIIQEDPFFPKDDEDLQCCCCGDAVPIENDPFVCKGFIGDGSTRCLHVVCDVCAPHEIKPGFPVCPCVHFVNNRNEVYVDPSVVLGQSQIQPDQPDPMLQATLNLLTEFKAEIINLKTPSNSAPRSQLKTTANMTFTNGSLDALDKLDTWLKEFDRVVAHVSAGQNLIAEDRIYHLLSCWPITMDVGENMRMDQQSEEYCRLEKAGDMEACWEMLLARLNSYRTEPAIARRDAEALWSGLYWPGDLDGLLTLIRRAVTALRKVHFPKAGHDIVIKFLEIIPPDKAIMLDDPIRRPPEGWTSVEVFAACKGFFSIDKAYLGTGGGLPRGGGNRQRAVWAIDRKMMQTPLGTRNGSKAGSSSGGHGSGGAGDCGMCSGSGHKDAQCPNHLSKKDKAWSAKSDKARANACTKCGGSGHWAHHHKNQNTQRQLRQPSPVEVTEPVSQQAQTQDKVCGNWKKFGVCTAPKDKCTLTHPKADKGPTEAGKESMVRMKTMDCHHHLRGTCHRGNVCLFAHDPKKQGSDKNAGTKGGGKGKTNNRSVGVEAEDSMTSVRVAATVVENEEPPFVFTRPTSVHNTNQRRVHPNDAVYDYNSFKHKLPKTKPPVPGYCHSTVLSVEGLPKLKFESFVMVELKVLLLVTKPIPVFSGNKEMLICHMMHAH